MEPEQPPQRYVLTEDNFAALVRLFMSPANPKWHLPPDKGGLAINSKKSWGGELRFMARPDCLGALKIGELRPSLVQAFFDGIADRIGKQTVALRALRALEKWAAKRDLLGRAITLGVEIGKSDGGHIPWTDNQVAIAEHNAKPDLAQLVTLGANTGQRCSDLVRMGWTDISTHRGRDGIRVVQVKTGREVWVPILEPLARAMATWQRQPGPFLRRNGRVWPNPRAASMAWDYERQNNPHLTEHRDTPLVIHGLRGHWCVKASREGLSDHAISDMIGMSVPMVSRYTRHSRQQDNAVAHVISLERWRNDQGEKPGNLASKSLK